MTGLLVQEYFRRNKSKEISFFDWKRLYQHLFRAGALPAIFLLYNFYISRFDSFAREWTMQNIIRSPGPAQYILAYGLMAPFAWFGARYLLKRDFLTGWFVTGWVVSFPILAYAPVDLQRRLVEGVWVAWCSLAMAAFDLKENESERIRLKKVSWSFFSLAFAFPSTLFLLIGGFQRAVKPAQPVFLPKDQVMLFETLQDRALAGSKVITLFDTGNALPAWAPVFVLIGHGPESIHPTEIVPRVEKVFQSSTPDKTRTEFFDRFNVRFIFWGPEERKLGDWKPEKTTYLRQFAEAGEYHLYEYNGAKP